MKDVFILSAKRTAIGSFAGCFSDTHPAELAATTIKAVIKETNITKNKIDELFFGNVLSANLGQAPARQALLNAKMPTNIPCTTINKVCSSGLKSILIAAQSIMCTDNKTVIAGGMENMSSAPYLLIRKQQKLGDLKLVDSLIKDGLTDSFNLCHMAMCVEKTAKKLKISRKEQDDFAINSYQKSNKAWQNNKFNNEVIPFSVIAKNKKKITISQDEEYEKTSLEKISQLKPAFDNNGTITAANASTINDGAAAVVLSDDSTCKKHKPIARVVAFADAACEPIDFATAPHLAIKKALIKANLKITDIDYFEINEAFAAVVLANIKLLKIDPKIVNIYGGAVSLGHPLGMSGTRIVVTLLNVLQQKKAKYGLAAICNGGGGASCLIVENLL
jgi:acetyl-CoA C-acetyltransferase